MNNYVNQEQNRGYIDRPMGLGVAPQCQEQKIPIGGLHYTLQQHEKAIAVLRESLGMLGERLNPILINNTTSGKEQLGTAIPTPTQRSDVSVSINNMTETLYDMNRRVVATLEALDL